ncbi:Far8p Ecym_4563 [Eremothecium cymbalariae DBVPG|uniref:Striatin N-terminal domain-containing protein n=1 Tax=Eremothecium cymbalariae (strain CBS 270.75 / DBVPG 7215 / KCTC 17166 / NRRL Y-17582) TaxID=931890 RepID=G8JU93_ERECY|nr:hypothetical protein Ecym_4563 [Eremothecium cymbalariae DBVPG\
MNQQAVGSPSANYTLPGVMHYLQTEFTKNERDRINWELERCEMKARIAQLEGENRDLRYLLLKTKQQYKDGDGVDGDLQEDMSFSEPSLLKSKLSVQENVKEIVYLLKSPQVTDQLDAWNNKGYSLHLLETMNLNCKKNVAEATNNSSGSGGGDGRASPMDASPTLPELEIPNALPPSPFSLKHGNGKNYDSDQETVILEDQLARMRPPSASKQTSTMISSSRRSSFSSLFDVNAGSPKNMTVSKAIVGSDSLAFVDKITVFQNNLLTLTGDGHLKYWVIDPTLELNDSLTIPKFHGLGTDVLGIFWWDSKTFITIDQTGLKVWSIELPEPVMQWDCFQNFEFENIDMIDFKNKWLVLKLGGKILIWKINIASEEDSIKMASNYEIWLDAEDPTFFILGLTEESLIVLYLDPCHLAIYNFQGKILQQLDLGHLVKDLQPRGKNTTRLVLNKKTSKVLVQINNQIIIYSFDQKKTVANFTLESIPSNIIFKFNSESIILGYADGTIEIRNLTDIRNIIKNYNHYDIKKSASAQNTNKGQQSDPNSETNTDDDESSVKSFMSMDIAVVDGTLAIVSGGDNGLIRLESVWEIAY